MTPPGGARRGAGRPRIHDDTSQRVDVILSQELLARLDRYVEQHELGSRSAAIRHLIDEADVGGGE